MTNVYEGSLIRLFRRLEELLRQMAQAAKVSQECKLDVNEEEYVQKLKWQLMETVYTWAQGKPFIEIW